MSSRLCTCEHMSDSIICAASPSNRSAQETCKEPLRHHMQPPPIQLGSMCHLTRTTDASSGAITDKPRSVGPPLVKKSKLVSDSQLSELEPDKQCNCQPTGPDKYVLWQDRFRSTAPKPSRFRSPEVILDIV